MDSIKSLSEIPKTMELAKGIATVDCSSAEQKDRIRKQLEIWKRQIKEIEDQLDRGQPTMKQSFPDPFILMRFVEFHFGEIHVNTVANNCWESKPEIRFSISLDGLTATSDSIDKSVYWPYSNIKGIRAKIPFSVDIPQGQQYNLLFYFEVLIKKSVEKEYFRIGLADETFSVNYYYLGQINYAKDQEAPYSICISENFAVDDVIGCGLLGKQRQIFFTKNGEPYGTPKYLPDSHKSKHLYPAVTLQGKEEIIIEANFGNNPLKPFCYHIPKHEGC